MQLFEPSLENRENFACKTSKAWLILSLVLTFALTFTLVYLHGIVLTNIIEPTYFDNVQRLLLSFLFFGSVVFYFRSEYLIPFLLLTGLLNFSIFYYSLYYDCIPSFLHIVYNYNEAIAVFDAILAMLPKTALACFLSITSLQIGIVCWRARFFVDRKEKHQIALLFLISWFLLLAILNCFSPNLFSKTHKVDSIYPATRFGVLLTLLRDGINTFLFFGDIEQANQEGQPFEAPKRSSLLNEEYGPSFPEVIACIQFETLDTGLLDYRIAQREVTPFLNAIRKTSYYYPVRASVRYGSATCDCVTLNGREVNKHLLNYNISYYPYVESLPMLFGDGGYLTCAVHGVTGDFYNRRYAFEKMKFHRLAFREELTSILEQDGSFLIEIYGKNKAERLSRDPWLKDEVLFDYAKQFVAENRDLKTFLYIITETSHVPFNVEIPRTIVANASSDFEKYVNTVHYTDRQIERFFETLPVDALVLIYGDHGYPPQCATPPDFKLGGYDNTFLLVSVKGQDLSKKQKNKDLTVSPLDIYSFVRKRIEVQESDGMEPMHGSPECKLVD